MSAQVEPVEPEVQQLQDFTGLDEYRFSGDSVTIANKRNFLAAYRTQSSIFHAAAIAGIARFTVYRYLDRDPVFAQAFADCKEDTIDTMRTSVYHDALNGNALLKMFWLKAHDARYRDRLQVDIEAVDREIDDYLKRRQLPAATAEFIDVDMTMTANPSPVPIEQKDDNHD